MAIMGSKSQGEFVGKQPQSYRLNLYATMPARIANDPISRERVLRRSRFRLRSWGDLASMRPQSPLSPPRRTFNLQGLDYGCQKPKDFYYPIFRDFSKEDPFSSGGQLDRVRLPPIFEPIDMAMVWKGLALSDCENLLSIQTTFKDCLEHLLEHQVTQFQDRVLKERRRNFDKSCAAADCTNASISHRFLFDRSQLLVAVSKALDASTNAARRDNSKTMRELLMLYLWSRDSLLYLPNGNSSRSAIDVRLKLYADHIGRSATFSTLEAMCIPHYLAFEKLDLVPQEGTKLVIKPHYRLNAPQTPEEPHTQVTYTLLSYHPWLHWDAEAKAFRGSLPYFSHQSRRVDNRWSHTQVHLLRIHIKALVVVSYPNTKIRLERTIGARLNLRVVPTPAAFSPPPPLFHDPFIVRRRSRSKVLSEASLKRQAQDQVPEESWNTHHDEVKTDADLREENPLKQSEQGTYIEKDSRENIIFATPEMIEVGDASRHTSSSLEQDTSQLSVAEGRSKRPKWRYTMPYRTVKEPVLKGWSSASTSSSNESRSGIYHENSDESSSETSNQTSNEPRSETSNEPRNEPSNEPRSETSNEPSNEPSNESSSETSTETSNASRGETSSETSNESRSETSSEREKRLDEEAGIFEMQYRGPGVSTLRMRRAAKHSIVTTLPFRPRTVREQNAVTSTPPHNRSASAFWDPSGKSPKAIVSDAVIEKGVTKARKRAKSKSKNKSSTGRRCAHTLNERLRVEAMMIRNQDRDTVRFIGPLKNEQLTKYPDTPAESDGSLYSDAPSDGGKCSVDPDVHRTEVKRCFGDLGGPSVPQQPNDCWNRKVPVVSWKDNQNFVWMKESSGSDPEAFDVRMPSRASLLTDDSTVAGKLRAHTMPARGSNRTSDTGAGSSTLVQSSKNSSRKRKCSDPNDEFNTISWKADKNPFFDPSFDPSSPSLMVEPVSIDPGPIDTHPRVPSFSVQARGILRTPSSHEEETDFFAGRERSVVSELLRSPDARQAFAQPLLSSDERAHIFEAMKRSLFDQRARVDPVMEGQGFYDALLSRSSEDMGPWSEDSLGSL
ncbi:MAG: hypothetical protein Q9203_004946 [Teloschistes exilis]